MTTLRTLKKNARKSAEWRGHKLGRFSIQHYGRAYARCENCNASVCVNTRPMPNQIDIGGDAVAVNCPNVMDK